MCGSPRRGGGHRGRGVEEATIQGVQGASAGAPAEGGLVAVAESVLFYASERRRERRRTSRRGSSAVASALVDHTPQLEAIYDTTARSVHTSEETSGAVCLYLFFWRPMDHNHTVRTYVSVYGRPGLKVLQRQCKISMHGWLACTSPSITDYWTSWSSELSALVGGGRRQRGRRMGSSCSMHAMQLLYMTLHPR